MSFYFQGLGNFGICIFYFLICMVVLFHEVNLTLSFGVEWIQVVEIIAQNLENESSLHKKVDLFFLVDSIAQFSRGLKGNYMSIFCLWYCTCMLHFFLVGCYSLLVFVIVGHIGGIYPSAIQGVLPRLVVAAAPPGSSSQENRRQCLKVRETFPFLFLFFCTPKFQRWVKHRSHCLTCFLIGFESLAGKEDSSRICYSTPHTRT